MQAPLKAWPIAAVKIFGYIDSTLLQVSKKIEESRDDILAGMRAVINHYVDRAITNTQYGLCGEGEQISPMTI